MASQGTVYAFIPSPYTWDSTLAKKIALNELRVGHNSDDGPQLLRSTLVGGTVLSVRALTSSI